MTADARIIESAVLRALVTPRGIARLAQLLAAAGQEATHA